MSRVFVGNLDFTTTRQNLESLFEPLGVILDLVLPVERDTGRPRGFAFVTFAEASSAVEAVRRLDGAELLGRSLRVSPASPKPERQRSGPNLGPDARPPGRPSRPKGSRRGLRGRKRSL